MNDLGLDQPAQEAARDVEKNTYESDRKQAEREERRYLDRSRWWFASTACPLIAGTFGPMANAFSICALPEKWRIYIPPESDEGHGQKIEDPDWLIAINSISLIFALVANLFLLLNMARRVSFAVAQPITLVGFYTASLLLMALVIVASTSAFRIKPMEQHALSQAYYYGLIASALYFIIAALMTFTVYGAYKGHYPKKFQLSPSQRTLMLQTMSFMTYLLLGALIFAQIEDWQFLDGVLFTNFTLLTIGLGGEFVPTTHTGRALLFPYAIGGLVMVGLVIGSIRSMVLEHGKQKMEARFKELKRQKVLSSFDGDTNTIKLGWFKKMSYPQTDLSETQRREQEFQVMRRILDMAESNRRYTSLALSTTASLLLWFLGALVFYKSEAPQGWTYFTALYFSYTSLLTVGYGDFIPLSNAGKVFFVFWTLLAVPTLTILISNMGETIIKEFKSFIMWIGSLTVLPGEEGLLAALRVGIRKISIKKLKKEEGYCGTTPEAAEKHISQRLAHHLANELKQEKGQGEHVSHMDGLERDMRFYHFVLAMEVDQMMKDVDASPPRQYTYVEWCYYLRLLGHDENDKSTHGKPVVHPKYNNHHHIPDLATAGDDHNHSWSWLGIRSPLMGSSTEAQWILRRLSKTLKAELRKLNHPHARRYQLPVTVENLKGREEQKELDDSQLMEKEISAAEVRRRGRNAV